MDTTHHLELDTTEIAGISTLLARVAIGDERHPLGNALLTTRDGTRTWVFGNGETYVIYPTTHTQNDLTVTVSRRIIDFLHTATENATLDITAGEHDNEIVATCAQRTLTVHTNQPPEPRLLYTATHTAAVEAVLEADATELRNHIDTAARAPRPLDDNEPPPEFHITANNGNLDITINWADLGISRYHMTTGGHGTSTVNGRPWALTDTLELFDGPITVTIGGPHTPICIHNNQLTAHSWPTISVGDRIRQHDEERLVDTFGPLAAHQDQDGDYPIRRHSIGIWARLIPTEPVAIQLFAVLLTNIAATPELHAELNDINAGLTYVRLMHVNNQVIAECDLVAHTVDNDELLTTARSVADIADRLTPIIAAVHGGTSPDAAVERHNAYRDTIIHAELHPGHWVALCGPGALHPWTLPTPVYLITADNPSGVGLSTDNNTHNNHQLAADIARTGGAHTRTQRHTLSGHHLENGFLIWDITQQDAIGLAQQHHQDIIFALDNNNITLINCVDGHQTPWPRHSTDGDLDHHQN